MEKVSRKFSFHVPPAPGFPITNVLSRVNLMNQLLSTVVWQWDSLLVLQTLELGQMCAKMVLVRILQFSFLHLFSFFFSKTPDKHYLLLSLSLVCPTPGCIL